MSNLVPQQPVGFADQLIVRHPAGRRVHDNSEVCTSGANRKTNVTLANVRARPIMIVVADFIGGQRYQKNSSLKNSAETSELSPGTEWTCYLLLLCAGEKPAGSRKALHWRRQNETTSRTPVRRATKYRDVLQERWRGLAVHW